MIPVVLELQAFLAFRRRVRLDFSELQQEKMFLITGNTGAGKTALFDAICFALYGEVSGSQRSVDSLKCQLAGDEDECFVSFSFENQGRQYLIRRTPPQMKKRRSGTVTLEKASAQLTLPDGSVLSSVREVNQRVEQILGLTAEQFKKIVMLPQGEFRRFLSDSSGGKQDILRRIFGTQVFEELTERLKGEYQKVTGELEHSLIQQQSYAGQLNPLDSAPLQQALSVQEPDLGQVYSLAQQQTEQAQQRAEALSRELAQCNEELRALDLEGAKQLNQRFEQLAGAREKLAGLEQQLPLVSRQQQLAKRLLQCGEVLPLYQSVQQTKTRLAQASQSLESQSQALEQADEKLRDLLPQYQQLLLEQKRAPELGQKLSELSQSLEAFQKRDAFQAQKQDLERRETLLGQYAKRAELLAQLGELQQNCSQLEEGKAGVRALIQQIRRAQEALDRWRGAYDRFLGQQAAFLARQLQDGSPCPVCGSKVHPAPAREEPGTAVSREELDRLSQQYEQRRREVEQEQSRLAGRLSGFGELAPPYEAVLNQLESQSRELRSQASAVEAAVSALHLEPNRRADSMSQEEFSARLRELDGKKQAVLLSLSSLEEQLCSLSRTELEEQKQELSQRLAQQSRQFESVSKQLEQARSAQDRLKAQKEQTQGLIAQYQQELARQTDDYQVALSAREMTEEEFFSLSGRRNEYDALAEQVRRYEQDRAAAALLAEHLTQELSGKQPADLDRLRQEEAALREQYQTLSAQYEELIKAVSQNQNVLDKLSHSMEESRSLMEQYQQIKPLYQAAAGHIGDRISLERYVLGVYFDRVIASANLRLEQMTGGRYFLRRRETREKGNAASGLELDVFDSNSGKFRHVNTLSGGESFKTALSLALGLADIITQRSGGVELNTLLIDEGFGTLDHDALESAVECLMKLRESGRYIGIISHVEGLRERIPAKLEVVQEKDGSIARFLPF